jgi:hypothetical protein
LADGEVLIERGEQRSFLGMLPHDVNEVDQVPLSEGL